MPTGLRAGPFRGLAAYDEGDAGLFFGRDQERARLLELVAAQNTNSPILVTGEAGAGKTSLLRAGLGPALRQTNLLPLYVECGLDCRRQFFVGLSRILGRPPSPDEDPMALLARQIEQRQARLLLAMDHVEQVAWLSEDRVEELRRLLAALRTIPRSLMLFVTDRGSNYALAQLARGLDVVAGERTVAVERFGAETAAQLMEQMVLAGGGYMEAGLPEAMIRELCAAGPVLPATMQAVGHAAVLRGATSLKQFNRVGGAEVLSTTYAERLAQRAGGWRARRALALLAEQPNPRATVTLAEIAHGSGLSRETTSQVVAELASEGLLRRCGELAPAAAGASPTEAELSQSYSLLHPFLHQPIRDYCAPVQRGRARARLALRRRLQAEQLLHPHEIFAVWRYLGEATSDLEQAKTQRSLRVWSAVAAGLAALPLLILLVLYLAVSGASYVHHATALPGVQRVVVRAGRPSLDFAFSLSDRLGKVQVDTGLALASLPGKASATVRERALSGDLLARGGPLEPWMEPLVAALPPVRRGAWLILAGHPGGPGVLLAAAKQREHRREAAEALALLSGDSAATRAALLQCVGDERPEVRRMAVREAERLGPGGLDTLKRAARDPDAQVRLAALRALRKVDAKASLARLPSALADADLRVQKEALAQLAAAAKSRPAAALGVISEASAAAAKRLAPIAHEIEQLRQKLLRKHPGGMARYLAEGLEAAEDPRRRVDLLDQLTDVADELKPDVLKPVLERLAKASQPEVRAAAIGLQARFGEPEVVMERLETLARSYQRPVSASVAMRRAAAVGAGLTSAKKSDRLKLLKKLLKDRAAPVRAAAVVSLLRLGGSGLSEVARALPNGPSDVAETALAEVCAGAEPDRRMATIVLGSAWKTKRTQLRAQALRCARQLAAASARLGLWLAHQAAVDKDPQVRQAAADAVALSLKRSGSRLLTLARIYLRDRDPETRAAVARAIVRQPPKPLSFLFSTAQRLTRDDVAAVRAASAQLIAISAPRPEPAVKELVGLLGDKDVTVVSAAVAAARHLRPGKGTAPLGPALSSVIARTGAKESIAALDTARELRLSAPVEQAAAHADEAVRAAAVEALARQADNSKALQVLESALREPASRMRVSALRALAEQSARLGEAAILLLWRSTRASDSNERREAFAALAAVRGPAVDAAVKLLKKEAHHRSEGRRSLAMRALGKLAERAPAAGAALVEGAVDPAIDVRSEAQAALAAYLGRFCRPQLLWKLLRGSGKNALVRRAMISALAEHGRSYGARWLETVVSRLGAEEPVVTRTAARLALALARSDEPPERIVSWLYGWQ